MQNKNARRRKLSQTRGKGQNGQVRVDSPPEFVPTFAIGHKFRFATSALILSKPVTRAMLLNLYTMASTTTNQSRLITAIKINRVSMWGQPTALGSATAQVSVEWVGNNSPSTIHSDTSLGVRAAYVRSRPPANASCSWWSMSGSSESEVLMNLSGPIGTVVDVDCSVRFVDDEGVVAGEAGTAAGAIAGTVYWNYLDGFASKTLAPVGGVRILP